MMSIMEQLSRSDVNRVPLQRLSAHDAHTLAIEKVVSPVAKAELENLRATGMRTFHGQVSPGAVGCYLSHVDVWRHVADTSDVDGDTETPSLVLEDDAHVPAQLREAMATGWALAKLTDPGTPILLLLHMICTGTCPQVGPYGLVKPSSFWSTAAYMLNGATAKALLSASILPVDIQIDSKLTELEKQGVVAIFYYPGVHTTGNDSDIQFHIHAGAPLSRNPAIKFIKTGKSS